MAFFELLEVPLSKDKTVKSVLFLFVASLLVMAGTANAALINGGFETGDLTGWQIVGDASVQTSSFGSGPTQGAYQAVLTNDILAFHSVAFGGASDPNLVYPLSGSPAVNHINESLLGLPSGSLQAITVAPSSMELKISPIFQSAIIQTFPGVAGSQLSFNWNYLTSDGYNYDYSFVSLTSSNLLLLEKLAGNDPSALPPPLVASNTVFQNETGFKMFSFILPKTGTYTLGIGVTGVADENFDSGLIIDDVKVASVPEPSTILLLGSALAMLAAWRWKQHTL